MTAFTASSRLADVLDNPAARAIVTSALAGVVNSPMLAQLRMFPIGLLVDRDPVLRSDEEARAAFWAQLEAVDGAPSPRVEPRRIDPDQRYEDDGVARASASITAPGRVRRYERIEVRLDGPSHGNPFVDVELVAEFHGPSGSARVGGFYDGDGVYVIRFLAEEAGLWEFETESTARSLDGLTGVVEVMDEPLGRGPVRVADQFHFAHADGTRHLPLGTTAYAWAHQPEAVQESTLAALAASPFSKIRMCVFPKSYLYNVDDPDRYAFPRREDGSWDVERFDVEFFRAFEARVEQLGRLGIQADIILFHPYDRWGFSDLGRAVDDRYARYLVRRLAAYSNVWWSMANEYDLLWSKTVEDWERLAGIVAAEDPVGHLHSIHHCFVPYDFSKPWITHCSIQRVDVYRTAENTTEWRAEWQKPVVLDEIGYEGDLDQGWGNLTAEELVRRFWEAAVRGGYGGHGETYYRDDEIIWWAKGGQLRGESPARIAFLRDLTAEVPGGVIEPQPSEWDAPWGGAVGEHLIAYFGFNRPSFRTFSLPGDQRWTVDIVDTWNMTVTRLPGEHTGTFRVDLPARQYMAVRFIAVEGNPNRSK
jgi:hypothetical protein